jgi:hypothetical protein
VRSAAIVIAVVGCSSGPAHFEAVRSGSYDCTADVVTNTCGANVPASSRRVDVDGGGTDLISLLAPSDGALETAPFEPPWSSIQFGLGSDPDVVDGSGSDACDDGISGHVYAFTNHAEVTRATEDELVIDVRYDFSDIAACAFTSMPVDACRLEWNVRCVPVS